MTDSEEWRPIIELPGASRDEIIVVLADGTVRTAARGLGTILLGPYGESARANNWPTHFRALPTPPKAASAQNSRNSPEAPLARSPETRANPR